MATPTLVKAAPAWSRAPRQSDYAALQASTADDLARLASSLASETIGSTEWYLRFANILLERHADAWVLGRRLAGDSSPYDVVDELVGRAKADQENEWLMRFLGDVESGRYRDDDGRLMEAQVAARSRMYSGKLRGTANEAFVEASPADEEFEWRLGGVEAHCSDCPELAAMSPWRKDELGTWPGDAGTPCLTNCKCRLVRESDGLSGFHPL